MTYFGIMYSIYIMCYYLCLQLELFQWLDKNEDGHLDIVEMAKGIAFLSRFDNKKRIESKY